MDEVGVLSGSTVNAVSALLLEHEKTTTEQIVVAVFRSLSDEDLVDRTLKIFQAWKVGKKNKDNGILLALYWDDRKSRMEVGYGLESLMTDSKATIILADVLAPELRQGDPNRAITLTALEMLTVLESPLIRDGRAQEILRSGGFGGGLQPRESLEIGKGWLVWVFLGFILLAIAFNILSSAEAHFTRGGWYRPNPWRRARRSIFWGSGGLGGGSGWGGGGSWGGGSGGGFLGGGGRSGGGGASGSW
jgi:uncharacterized protein